MRIFKSHPLLKLINSYLIDSPQPANLSYLWNFGSLLAFCLAIQIVTGVTLAMHYNPSVLEAFNSVEHIMRDVNNGWLIRYLHSNTASAFFFLVYLHIGRGLYYGSYRAPRTLVWTIGTVIFILMIVTAFLGYVLPYGQMSLWGATVITNLMSAIPWIGQDIVEFLWGGFSVNNATLNRFFALHFVLPFVLAALVIMHLIALHDSAGSGNPAGVSGNYDRLPFAPYFLFKDLVTIFLFIFILSVFVFFMPNVLGDSENYVVANPMQTPPAIVPEWYLLPFYAILRSIPNKLLGVIAMLTAILMLLTLPFADLSRTRGMQFRPLSKIAFYIFIANFLILMVLGAKHVESPFIEFGQGATLVYFGFFAALPLITMSENTLVDLSSTTGNISAPLVADAVKIMGSPKPLSDNGGTKSELSLFDTAFSYIEGLSQELQVKDLHNYSEYLVDPCHLYRSDEKDDNNWVIENKYPYISDILATFRPSSDPKVDELKVEQLLDLKLKPELMSKLKLEFNSLHKFELNQVEFIREAIIKHNSEYVTLCPEHLQIKDKEIALSKLGHNTPSPENFTATPFDNTKFENIFNNEEEEWKAVWLFLAAELDIALRVLYYVRSDANGSMGAELASDYSFWLTRQLTVYLSHEKESLFEKNNYVRDFFALGGENPMHRELLEDILYVQLNLLLAKRIIEKSANLSVKDCIIAHYKEYSEGYSYLKALRMYNINNYYSNEMLYYIGLSGSFKDRVIRK